MLKSKRTKKEQKEIVIKYIHLKQKATVSEIQNQLKVNIHRLFGGIEEAFNEACIEYPRKKENIKKQIIGLLRKDPLITIEKLQKILKISFYKHFNDSREVYKLAKTPFISNRLKCKMKKQGTIIEYIKNHPNATQWEINKNCKTHVQEIFNDGIKGAFKKAELIYPLERLKIYGIARKKIKHRAYNFENKILNILKSIGARTHVRTKHGIADAVVQIDGNPCVIEIKDYKTKPISLSEIKQINKYLNDLKCKNGIIICSGNRSVDRVKFDSKEIIIVPENYISKLEWGLKGHGTSLN